VRAQQGERLRRIGVLMSTGADDPEGQARIAAFLGGLQVPIAGQPDLWTETVKLRDQGEYRFRSILGVHVLKIVG
jgi:hypothetical protein